MTGFKGLVISRFQGDENLARAYVGDLGRAAYFYRTKPAIAVNTLKWAALWIPELFVIVDGHVVDIAWRSDYMKERGSY